MRSWHKRAVLTHPTLRFDPGRADDQDVASPRTSVAPAVVATADPLAPIIGGSPAVAALRREVALAARFDAPALIQGETGTGKELVARALHAASARAAGPFVAFNCAGVVALFESELFGHAQGAFTGASRAQAGMFRAAAGGCLFLDEVGDMRPDHQAKVLRVLETMEVRPVGSAQVHPVDVRVIAATHVDLRHAVAQGRFRLDLYYRLAGARITVPPLRDRGDDVALLACHFLDQAVRRYRLGPRCFGDEALAALVARPWQGNVRELRRVVETASMRAEGRVLVPEDLPPGIEPIYRRRSDRGEAPRSAPPDGPAEGVGGDLSLASAEGRHVARVLALCSGNRTRAAEALGVSRRTLYRLLERHDLT